MVQHNPRADSSSTPSPLKKYSDVCNGVGQLKGFEQKLHVDKSVPPVAQTYPRIPFNLRPQLEKWLQDAKDNDLIEPVLNQSSEWVSGLVLVPKTKEPSGDKSLW